MGCGTFTSSDWKSYTTSRGITGQSTYDTIYKSRSMKDSLNPNFELSGNVEMSMMISEYDKVIEF